ncbi:Uncharacterized conserved protein, DUF58 family, contains vWF domain [Sulfobacillus thermosulfidooxidans DSM 9293]|uniref:Uncharacterized conserved protein, DUF58 family, contains vWF domain n=1 Tax=Sulfobacillus thermosulfidooxidans (strain DSM 9293 / VKM B-1269 / AT-1) TaxID=929705 RepID=A0A1W1W9V5_SULTA|nr:DUF58 domain-containing protein [Sulfobacillus thermosulfidooxidans]SMC03077.1 Uncharacterized conserved protein, DUF58 family, contains vWF domain [Sulfobacillus thermosulfidooxidans DSM 9293]
MIWTTWSSRGIQIIAVILFLTGVLTQEFLIVTTAIFILVALFLANYMALQAFSHLQISSDRQHIIVESGETFHWSAVIANPLNIAAGRIQLRQDIPSGFSQSAPELKTEFVLGPHQQARVDMMLVSENRGRWIFPPLDLYQTDLLGWTDIATQKASPVMVTVWPKRIILPADFWRSARAMGDIKGQRWDEPDPSLYIGIRRYQPGDPLKWVHPYASMRMRELMIKEIDHTRSFHVEVICHPLSQLQSWYGIDREAVEDCFVLAASAVESALNQDFACGLTISCPLPGYGHGVSLPPVTGHSVVAEYLTNLAWAIPSGSLSSNLEMLMNQIILRNERPGLIVVVSPLWDPVLSPYLRLLAEQGYVIGWLTTSAEAHCDDDVDIRWQWKKGREIYAQYMARVI